MSILGADISGWQPGNVNLTGLEFVYIKSTQGTYKVNANHDAQVAQARAAGLVVGHYHFPAWGNPVAEAQAFVSANGALPGEFLVLDIEDSPQTPWPANPVPWCVAFVDEVHRLTGLWCLNYCGPNVRHTWDWTTLAQRGGGLISPEYNNYGPSNPAPWADTAMWQNANTNISGGDSDVFFGDRNALLAYGTPNGVTLDGTTITPIPEDAMTPEESARLTNVEAILKELYQQILPGKPGVKTAGDVYLTLDAARKAAEDAANSLAYGVPGVRTAGPIAAALANLPAAVWNQNIGTGNAAGVINHIDAKPVATNAVTGAPFDTDAFIARLVATLPPAIRADLKNAL